MTDKNEDKLVVEMLDDEGKVLPDEKDVTKPDSTDTATKEPDEFTKYQAEAAAKLKALEDELNQTKSRYQEIEAEKEEVIRFARNTHQENKRLAGLIQSGEKVLVDQAGGRVKAELVAAEQAFKAAYEAGDTEKMLQAQKDIARLSVEEDKVRSYQPVQVNQPAQQVQQQVKPDAKSDAWLKKNADWWMKDDAMTGLAMGLHAKAVKTGLRPGTDEYIGFLDTGMQKAFPDHFKTETSVTTQIDTKPASDARPRTVGTVVAPATRSGGKTTQKVQITPSMASVARRLGVPVESYALEMARIEQNG